MKKILARLLRKKVILAVVAVSLFGGIIGGVIYYAVSKTPAEITPTSTLTLAAALTPTPMPAVRVSATVAPTVTPTIVQTPSLTSTPNPVPVPIPVPILTPSPTPTSTPTPRPTLTPTPMPAPASTPMPAPTATPKPPEDDDDNDEEPAKIIRVGGPGNALFSFKDSGFWWPGRTVEKWGVIKNIGDLTFVFSITVTGHKEPIHDAHGDGANVGLEVSFPKVTDVGNDDHDETWHIKPGSSQRVLIKIHLPSKADNTVQGDRWDVTFTVRAVQH